MPYASPGTTYESVCKACRLDQSNTSFGTPCQDRIHAAACSSTILRLTVGYTESRITAGLRWLFEAVSRQPPALPTGGYPDQSHILG